VAQALARRPEYDDMMHLLFSRRDILQLAIRASAPPCPGFLQK
jgi:hypothetical protein